MTSIILPAQVSGLASIASALVPIRTMIEDPSIIIDKMGPGVYVDAVHGRYFINGLGVGLTDIFTFSGGSKKVLDQSGKLVTIAANQPAFDWSTGRRRLLIEAAAATKYGPYSETIGAHWFVDGAAAVGTALGADGTAGLSEIIEDASIGYHRTYASPSYYPTVVAGEFLAVQVDVKAGAGGRNVGINMTGAGVAPAQTLIVNPATGAVVSQSAGISRVSITARPGGIWHVEATFSTTATGATWLLVYLASGSAIHYAGNGISSILVGYVNVEKVASAASTSSSYVSITGNAAVTRIADDVRLSAAALAILNVAAATLCLRGQLRAPPVGIQSLIGDVDARRMLYTSGTDDQIVTYYGDATGTATAATGALSAGFGAVVARWLGGASKLCLNGGAVAALTTDPAETLATARLFADNTGGGACNGWIDEVVLWPFVGSDAALQAQAHVYGA